MVVQGKNETNNVNTFTPTSWPSGTTSITIASIVTVIWIVCDRFICLFKLILKKTFLSHFVFVKHTQTLLSQKTTKQ